MKGKLFMTSKVVIKEWVYKADQDFGFASAALANSYEFYDQLCFFFQQAGEKYLKAYIVKHELPFKKVHNLVELMEICKTNDTEFENLRDACKTLNPLYIEPRYGDTMFKIYTKEEALSAQEAARKIQQFVRKKLGIEQEITTEEMQKTEEEADQEFRELEGK